MQFIRVHAKCRLLRCPWFRSCLTVSSVSRSFARVTVRCPGSGGIVVGHLVINEGSSGSKSIGRILNTFSGKVSRHLTQNLFPIGELGGYKRAPDQLSDCQIPEANAPY